MRPHRPFPTHFYQTIPVSTCYLCNLLSSLTTCSSPIPHPHVPHTPAVITSSLTSTERRVCEVGVTLAVDAVPPARRVRAPRRLAHRVVIVRVLVVKVHVSRHARVRHRRVVLGGVSARRRVLAYGHRVTVFDCK